MNHPWRACVAFALCCTPAAAAADGPAPSRSMTLEEEVVPPNPVSPGPFGNTLKALPACDPETPDQARERMAAVALLQLFQLFAWADGYVRTSYFTEATYHAGGHFNAGAPMGATGLGLTAEGIEKLKQGARNMHKASNAGKGPGKQGADDLKALPLSPVDPGPVAMMNELVDPGGERGMESAELAVPESPGTQPILATRHSRRADRSVKSRAKRLYLSAKRFFEGAQEGPQGARVRQAYLHLLDHWLGEGVAYFELKIVAEPNGEPGEQMVFEGQCGSSYYIFEASGCVPSVDHCGCPDIDTFLDDSVVWWTPDGDQRPNDYFRLKKDLEDVFGKELLNAEVLKARTRTAARLAEQSGQTAVSDQAAALGQASGGSIAFQPDDSGGSPGGGDCELGQVVNDTLIGLDPQSYEEPVCTQLFAEDHRLCTFSPYDTLQAQEGEPDAHVMGENSAAIPMRRCEPCALDTGGSGLIAPSPVWDNVMECVTHDPSVQDVKLDPCYDDPFSDDCMDILDICDPL